MTSKSEITPEQARAVLVQERRERAKQCEIKIQAALDEFGFQLVAELLLADGRVIPTPITLIDKHS